jgi:LmbE family N-acetylglucosaminyl deacetylase
MGATHYHFNIRDCIYRTSPDGTPLYPSESAIFGPVHALEAPLQEEVSGQLRQQIPQGAEVVAPLSLGGHSDHRLVRQAAERLRRPLWFYLDYPYILKNDDPSHEMVGLNWTRHTFPISESGLEAWCEAIAAHASQISSFWPDLDAMRAAIRRYCESNQGIVLWKQEDRYESQQ